MTENIRVAHWVPTISLALLLATASACHYVDQGGKVVPSTSEATSSKVRVSSATLQKLYSYRETLKAKAPECHGTYEGQMSESPTECNEFDTTHFAGYSCYAAYLAKDVEWASKRCRDVAVGQDPNTGRWWRGQQNRDKNLQLLAAGQPEGPDSFSRDMHSGVMIHFTVSGLLNDWDLSEKNAIAPMAKKWVRWIDGDGHGRLCLSPSDTRCSLYGGASGMMYLVYKRLGAYEAEGTSPTFTSMKNNSNKFKRFLDGGLGLSFLSELKATPVGFELHLKAATTLFLHALERSDLLNGRTTSDFSPDIIPEAWKAIAEKDPENPYYDFLGNGVSDPSAQRLFDLIDSLTSRSVSLPYDWLWQRKWEVNSLGVAMPNSNSSIHDMIFLLNLMIADANGDWCKAGQACSNSR